MTKSGFSNTEQPEKRVNFGRWAIPGWLALHALLLLTGFLSGPLTIDTSFFSILPAAQADVHLAEADRLMSRRLNSRMRVLVGARVFADARRQTELLARDIAGITGVSDVLWLTGEESSELIRSLVFEHRYHLLNDADRKLLENGSGQQLADDALAEVYSPFSMARLDRLEEDPFLLTDRILRSYLDSASRLGGAFSPRDGVMTAEYDGLHYVLLTIDLEEEGDVEGTIDRFQDVLLGHENGNPNSNYIVSGFPLHNAESSRNAQREIGIITGISLAVLTLLLILVFRSPMPWASSLAMIGIAAASSIAQTLLVFGRIHVFTLVFGTSLIGISIDYSLHYFVARMQAGEDQRPWDVVLHILPGIGLGMATTVISYLALALTPIPLLRQIAVFSIVGLASSFLTVILVFPRLQQRIRPKPSPLPSRFDAFLLRRSRRTRAVSRWMYASFGAVVGFLLLGLLHLEMNNDVRSFYTMSPELARNEQQASLVGGSESLSRYFVVLGDDADQLLERETALTKRLSDLESDGTIDSWIGVSRFLPTKAMQADSYQDASMVLPELAISQFAALGFPDEAAGYWQSAFDDAEGLVLGIEEALNQPFFAAFENIWIGDVGGRFASVVIPYGYAEVTTMKALEADDIHWVQAVEDISSVLQKNSRRAMIIVGIAYGAIFLFLSAMRGIPTALRICIVPFAAAASASGVIGWIGAPFNLFAVFGLILTLGIGIDYTIFLHEGRTDAGATYLAIALSCLSTLLSFGALSMSSFSPVADFGRAVLWGVLFSFLLAPIVLRREPPPVRQSGNRQ